MKMYYWFGIYLLLGLWLVVSPYALGFTDHSYAFWNAIGSGLVAGLIALAGMYDQRETVGDHGFSQKSPRTA